MEVSKEQADALQEKVKNMSPEELREFQKQQCIFCHIISGKVSSKKVYEDDKCMAILDINPANPGHIVLLPKEHYAIMPQLNDEEISHLFMTAKHLSHALLKALKAEGINIFIANGIAAGQRAQHFMIHIIPRKENDSLNLDIPQQNINENDLNKLSDMLTKAIAEKIGAGFEETPEKKEMPAEQAIEIIEPKPLMPIIKEQRPKKAESEPPQQYVKSENSDKFHNPICPFAKRIKEPVFLTKQQTNKLKPCACVTDEPATLAKTKSKSKGGKRKNKSKEKEKTEIKKSAKLEEKKKPNLDNIAELLGAR